MSPSLQAYAQLSACDHLRTVIAILGLAVAEKGQVLVLLPGTHPSFLFFSGHFP